MAVGQKGLPLAAVRSEAIGIFRTPRVAWLESVVRYKRDIH
jgi:hypothetical protein